MGFGPHFGRLIKGILRSARLSISINGCLEGFFSCSRGVQQGDPLSPLLFSLGEDILAKMIDYQGGVRQLRRAEAKLGVLVHSNFLYADDIMIFCKATRDNTLLLRDIFLQYGRVSGQVVSPSKSRIFFGNQVSEAFKYSAFHELHFVEGSLPCTYLGVTVFYGKPRVSHLQPLADKIVRSLIDGVVLCSRWQAGFV